MEVESQNNIVSFSLWIYLHTESFDLLVKFKEELERAACYNKTVDNLALVIIEDLFGKHFASFFNLVLFNKNIFY